MPPLITVWRIPLNVCDKVFAQLQLLLSDEESCTAAQFKSDIHRRRYIVRHGAMRRILSLETECAPNELRFLAASFGKPLLENPFGRVQFNLSHSADIALLAICPYGAVGVDIEVQEPLVDFDGLVTQVCSSAEAQLVVAGADAEQMFYRCWVGKEAVLKCLGYGLRNSIKELEVLDAHGHLMCSPALPVEWSNSGTVDLHLLDKLPQGFVGAVAVLQTGKDEWTETEVCMQDWES